MPNAITIKAYSWNPTTDVATFFGRVTSARRFCKSRRVVEFRNITHDVFLGRDKTGPRGRWAVPFETSDVPATGVGAGLFEVRALRKVVQRDGQRFACPATTDTWGIALSLGT